MPSLPSLEVERIVARFLDSREARGLGLPIAEVRRFALLFVGSAVDDLGCEPWLFDEETLLDAIDRTARKLGRGDPLAKDGGRILRAFYDHLNESEVVPSAYEIDKALDGIESRFLPLTAKVADADRITGETKRIENRAAKVGRNEPCPCGSGKKFKQCCGRAK